MSHSDCPTSRTTKALLRAGRLSAAALIASFVSVGAANAVSLSISGGTNHVLGTEFNPSNGLQGLTSATVIKTFGAGESGGLYVLGNNTFTLSFTYFGFEAGDPNKAFDSLTWASGDTPFFVNGTSSLNDVYSNSYTVSGSAVTCAAAVPGF